jgi:folate-dependent phosphoribosylglycinamide formyltransferase PurN
VKLVLLTTETPHHAFYAREVHRRFPLRAVHLERACPAPPFPTAHPFERERDAHERAVLLDGRDGFAELCPTRSFESLNDAEATTALAEVAPEVVLVFGTGRLRTPTFRAARLACLNVHGGNPEEYRGLDSHLWAIYHRDWANLVTTLHHVDADLDTGDVVFQSALTIGRAARLHELRAINTRLCVDLTLLALEALASTGRLPARRQVRRGRYYSFMPAVLKDVCVGRFAQWTATLS